MKKLMIIAMAFVSVSCLKKVEEVETANTNIFDPEYVGGQWWVFDDVYVYTNSNNDQKVRFDYSIPSANAPDLKPTQIDLMVSINNGTPFQDIAEITQNGRYEGSCEINPSSSTNYCLEIGVYVEEEELTINSFMECKDL